MPRPKKQWPTTTALLARLRVWQPTQRPQYMRGEWIETAWGRCRVNGRLGQRHADLFEAINRNKIEARKTADGRIELLVDPARLKRSISDSNYSSDQLNTLMRDLVEATIEINAPRVRAMGHLIDTWRASEETAHHPLTGGRREMWIVTIGDAMIELVQRDLLLHYDPAPISRLRSGVSQAVTRHALTHRRSPPGGWHTDALIEIVAGRLESQQLRDARRGLRADVDLLDEIGVEIASGRIRRNRKVTLENGE